MKAAGAFLGLPRELQNGRFYQQLFWHMLRA
jgi:hypothetical protein